MRVQEVRFTHLASRVSATLSHTTTQKKNDTVCDNADVIVTCVLVSTTTVHSQQRERERGRTHWLLTCGGQVNVCVSLSSSLPSSSSVLGMRFWSCNSPLGGVSSLFFPCMLLCSWRWFSPSGASPFLLLLVSVPRHLSLSHFFFYILQHCCVCVSVYVYMCLCFCVSASPRVFSIPFHVRGIRGIGGASLFPPLLSGDPVCTTLTNILACSLDVLLCCRAHLFVVSRVSA